MIISWRDLRKVDPAIKPEDDKETKAWLDEIGTEEEWQKKVENAKAEIEALCDKINRARTDRRLK